ncbi:hypothetical protein SEVIR_9G298932v4 [Setaria viridis]|uniref:Uncharacterized protein n=1 Tax=Setaria viridis TaxID=4556 RepID=A0A4U6TBP0_SETVI|nr:hypothetical protein SEVIR_9G299333v2 [Setaria viridis]TKV94497.1 hypothetical protein SEVIR_9G299366v2 [Setaria viridis]
MASLARSAHVLGITLLVIAAVMITSTPFVECRAVERPRAAMVNSDPRAADRFEKSRPSPRAAMVHSDPHAPYRFETSRPSPHD